jgi:hypothetical protein
VRWWARCLLAVLALAGGAATGLAAVAVHATPWGWPLAVATVLLTAYALPGEWWARLPFCWAFAGVAFALTQTRPSGGFLVSADLPGYGLLGVAAAVAVLGPVGTIRSRRPVGDAP